MRFPEKAGFLIQFDTDRALILSNNVESLANLREIRSEK
jgi:hypothetical protein